MEDSFGEVKHHLGGELLDGLAAGSATAQPGELVCTAGPGSARMPDTSMSSERLRGLDHDRSLCGGWLVVARTS
jgi:hypothetical protein